MNGYGIWDRWQSQRIASAFRAVRGLASALGFVVGIGLTYAIAPLLGRILHG